MKKLITLILTSILLSTLMAHDVEKKESDYLFINFSYNQPEVRAPYIDAIGLQVTIGYQFSKILALTVNGYGELHSSQSFDDISFTLDKDNPNSFLNLLEDAEVERTTSFFVNLELNNISPLSFLDIYIGAGIGRQSITEENLAIEGVPEAPLVRNTIEENTLVYQAYAGLRFFLSDNFAIFGELRHIVRADDFEDAETEAENINTDINSVALGVYFNL